MQTQCPYVQCADQFEVSDNLLFGKGNCIGCGRPITFRPLDLVKHIQRIDQSYKNMRNCGANTKSDPEVKGSVSLANGSVLAVIEDVRSLFNVGSIFRTADGAGITHLYLCGITGCPPNKHIEKVSLGAENHLNWSYAPSSLNVLSRLAPAGVLVIGLEKMQESQSLSSLLSANKIKAPICIVVGNEVTGLSAEALDNCDLIAHLPMYGKKESLNVAVAFGIATYMLVERLRVV